MLLRRQHLQAQICNEGIVMVRALHAWDQGTPRGYQNHAAVKMWRGHTRALCAYLLDLTACWRERGYDEPVTAAEYRAVAATSLTDDQRPIWWSTTPLHRQHTASLVNRNPEHYAPIWPGVAPIATDGSDEFLWPPDPTQPEFGRLYASQLGEYVGRHPGLVA